MPVGLRSALSNVWDSRLKSVIPVKHNKTVVFKVYDYGSITRMRAKTFSIKEPETINWIDNFKADETFLDIGANIGIYSLYAASRAISTISVEPDSSNYGLLNLNISLNELGSFITPYSIAIHGSSGFSYFNVSSQDWGGALNAFDNTIDAWGQKFTPVHRQGVYGMTLDHFCNELKFYPTHVKIDVDGNESLILDGSPQLLESPSLKSLLVELDTNNNSYTSTLQMLESRGFKLSEKTHSPLFSLSKYSTIFNHIFTRN